MEVARNFMTTFTSLELESLPAVCQPGSILTAPDVTDYASRLVQHRCEDTDGIAYAIHRLATFFSGASARIDELRQEAKKSSHQTSA